SVDRARGRPLVKVETSRQRRFLLRCQNFFRAMGQLDRCPGMLKYVAQRESTSEAARDRNASGAQTEHAAQFFEPSPVEHATKSNVFTPGESPEQDLPAREHKGRCVADLRKTRCDIRARALLHNFDLRRRFTTHLLLEGQR